jgi:hypothetical protein
VGLYRVKTQSEELLFPQLGFDCHLFLPQGVQGLDFPSYQTRAALATPASNADAVQLESMRLKGLPWTLRDALALHGVDYNKELRLRSCYIVVVSRIETVVAVASLPVLLGHFIPHLGVRGADQLAHPFVEVVQAAIPAPTASAQDQISAQRQVALRIAREQTSW